MSDFIDVLKTLLKDIQFESDSENFKSLDENDLVEIATSLADEKIFEGLRIPCHTCDKTIVKPGALLFSPPDAEGKTEKTHLCVECWEDVRRFLWDARQR